MDEEVPRSARRTRRKKRSSDKRKNEEDNIASQESTNEDSSPVRRVLRNRKVESKEQEGGVKKRGRRRKKKKSVPEDTENTEVSDASTAKLCPSSADDNLPESSTKKFESPKVRRRASTKGNGFVVELQCEDEENIVDDDVVVASGKKKKKKISFKETKESRKKSVVQSMSSDSEQPLINDTFEKNTDVQTPEKRSTDDDWHDATDHNFEPPGSPGEAPRRGTYRLEQSTLPVTPIALKQRKKWDLSTTVFEYSSPGIATTRRGSSFRKTPFPDRNKNVEKLPILGGKRRSMSVEEIGRVRKVSFAVGNPKEVGMEEEKSKRRTYSFDGIDNCPVVCKNATANLFTDSLLENTPKLDEGSKVLDVTSPPWCGESPLKVSTPGETSGRRQSLAKRLSKPKVSPQNRRLSTSLKASKRLVKTPKITGETAQALLSMIEHNEVSKVLRPSGTSTPRPQKTSNTSLMKSILEKSKRNCSVNDSLPSPAKIKRSKMPNFSLIHQRQFDRMESISGYKERREERAELLFSGAKVPACYSSSKNALADVGPSSSKACSKQLEFGKKGTPKKAGVAVPTLKNNTPKASPKRPTANAAGSSKTNVSKADVSKDPAKVKASTTNIPVASKTRAPNVQKPEKLAQSTANLRATNPTHKTIDHRATGTASNRTRFGFKALPAKPNKEERMALANKTRVPQTNVQDRRNVLNGVRSNRRFELLMKMRQK